MLVLRSLTVGLLGVCVWTLLILVDRSEPQWCAVPRIPAAAAPAHSIANAVSIIDLATLPGGESRGLRDLAELVRLAPDERIVAVDDRPVEVSLGCSAAPHYCSGVVLGGGRYVDGVRARVAAGSFVDFTVASAMASRRVLVLAH